VAVGLTIAALRLLSPKPALSSSSEVAPIQAGAPEAPETQPAATIEAEAEAEADLLAPLTPKRARPGLPQRSRERHASPEDVLRERR
jgi:hypothetical protein